MEKAENVVELRDSIEILPLEKEELVAQLIDELYIAGLIKPENQYQMVEELQRTKKEYHLKKQLFNSLSNLTIVTPSNWLKERVEESFLKNNKIVVIPNGIDLSKSKVSQKFDKFTVLAVASYWTKEKGIDELKKIIPLLNEDIDIIVVGELKDKDPIFNRCKLIGRTNNYKELIELYSKSHLLINPSLEDIFGLVNIEAQSCGTPVAAYNTGGIPETIESGKIIEKEDKKELANAIDLIKKDYIFDSNNIASKMKKYNIKNMVSNYIDQYYKMR